MSVTPHAEAEYVLAVAVQRRGAFPQKIRRLDMHKHLYFVATSLATTGLLFACGGGDDRTFLPIAPTVPDASPAPTIQVLSSDPAYVSGGDALISVSVPSDSTTDSLKVQVNGKDVSTTLTRDSATNSLRGMISGLATGQNKVEATLGAQTVNLTLKNYPREGPIFSGPQLTPWTCRTVEQGLGPARDAGCNVPPKFEYLYKSVANGTFKPYDPANPPPASDMQTVTTDHDVTVNYIVRLETGSVDRSIYQVAVLFDPTKPWTPFAAQSAWNHKLYVPTAGGFNKFYNQGNLPLPAATNPQQQDVVLNDMALKRGFMVAKTTFWVPLSNMSPVMAAESLMMLKEHIAEQYGSIRYTFTSGASGGSITMAQVANSYPGLLQGISPQQGFLDIWGATYQEILDCNVLRPYFQTGSPTLWSNAADRIAVYGHADETSCTFFLDRFYPLQSPALGAVAVDAQTRLAVPVPVAGPETYDSVTNPGGARGTGQDYWVNFFGRRSADVWTTNERTINRGFARNPMDNVGVEYGLQALLGGKISPEQFVDMNEKVGGTDIDFNRVPRRNVQDAGVAAATYRMGFVNDARQMDQVAILNVRLPDVDPTASHSMVHDYIYMDRLTKAHGHRNNQALWIIPGYNAQLQHEMSFVQLDRWLTAIEADKSSDALAVKVARNKPADVVDGCWAPGTQPADTKISTQVKDMTQCRAWYPVWTTPRIASTPTGDRGVGSVTKCQLKPLVRNNYAGVTFTDPQWARLQAVYPGGTCDYSKPDAAQTESVPWLDYTNGAGGMQMTAPARTPAF
jgi:hypothetical protein